MLPSPGIGPANREHVLAPDQHPSAEAGQARCRYVLGIGTWFVPILSGRGNRKIDGEPRLPLTAADALICLDHRSVLADCGPQARRGR